ncbi:MAG: molecular chaperone HtpG [Chlamydiota bacterium]
MTVGKLQIHSENILPIIKRWLYSDKDIFVRELVSNACDALHKLKVLREQGAAASGSSEGRVDIKINKDKRTLKFVDTGIGMTAEEVEKYIAQLAFSGAEEFVKKYQSQEEQDQIIGHFGLGFYSAFMVSEKVAIETLSYQEGSKPVHWECDGGSQYEIKEGSRDTVGTEITLYVDKDSDEYLEEARLREILNKYCSFLPYPIYLNDNQINNKEPLWMKPASECTEEEYLEFYRQLYPMQPDPLFWVHLNVDYPFNLRGILYFPRVKQDMDFRKNTIKLFCNRVFVNDNCQDLIPEYLMILQGAIDSPDIPLNVSRSYLQMDRTVRQLSRHISKKVSDRLSSFYKTDREKFLECWKDIEVIIKLGAMEDEKFYTRVKDFLVWQTTDGEWTTVEEYLERNKDKIKDKVFYTTDERGSRHFLNVYKDKGLEVLASSAMIDTHLMSFLERHISPAKFQRIDSAIDDAIIDKEKENTLLDADGKTESGKLKDFIQSKLGLENLDVEARSLASATIPAIITIDEDQRRFRDYMRVANPAGGEHNIPIKRILVVNTNNSLVKAIPNLEGKDADLTKEMVNHIYESALLSQKELDPEALAGYVERSNKILEQFAAQAL